MRDRAEQEKRERLQDQLTRIQDQISDSMKPDPRLLNQAGDLYAQLGDDQSALKSYGKAINGFIAGGQTSAATALCSKLIRRYPNVVRAHFTLACLALHQGLWVDARNALQAYVSAAIENESQTLAIPRLRFLSRGVTEPQMRDAIAGMLAELGDREEARAILTQPPKPLPSGIRRERIFLDAPTWDSDAMWATFWTM